jgi:hypothetical protein
MGTFGTDDVSDDRSDERALELPAPVNPGIFGTLDERFPYEAV